MSDKDIQDMMNNLNEFDNMMRNYHFQRRPQGVITSSPANKETVSRYNNAAKNEARKAIAEKKKIELNRKKILKNKWKAIGRLSAGSTFLFTGIFVSASAPTVGVAYFAVGIQSKHMIKGFKEGLKTWREDKKNSKILGTKMARFKHAVSVGAKAFAKSSVQGMRKGIKFAKDCAKYEFIERPYLEARFREAINKEFIDMKKNRR